MLLVEPLPNFPLLFYVFCRSEESEFCYYLWTLFLHLNLTLQLSLVTTFCNLFSTFRQKRKYNYISFNSLSINYDFQYWIDVTIVNSISHNELFVKSNNGTHIFTALIVLEDSPHYLSKHLSVRCIKYPSPSSCNILYASYT